MGVLKNAWGGGATDVSNTVKYLLFSHLHAIISQIVVDIFYIDGEIDVYWGVDFLLFWPHGLSYIFFIVCKSSFPVFAFVSETE